jgi:thioredoxin-related protein
MKLTSPLFIALLTLGSTSFLVSSPPKYVIQNSEAKRQKFDPTRDAAKDIEAALKKATKEKKRVILDVGGEWCSWCHKLDKLFAENIDLNKFMTSKYVVVKVNFSPENENKEVLAKYPKITGYPHLFVLDSKGKLLHSQDTGLLETGAAHDPEKVMTFLKTWATK